MFQVIKYNKESEMFTIKDSTDNSCEDIDIDMLNKLESIGVSPLGFSNGSLDSSVEVVTNTKTELSDIFHNLSEDEVLSKCDEYRKQGLSDDEIFSELYKLDNSVDDEYDDYDEEDYDDYDDYEDDYEEDIEDEDDFDEDDYEDDEEYDDFTEEDMYPEDEETEEAFENFYSRYDEDNARFYSHLNDSQAKAFRHFSRWYTKAAFSSANSLRLKLTTQTGYKAKKTKQLIQLSGVDNWEFDGMEVGIRQGDFECSLGHKLKNCYYAINQSKLEKTGETEYIQFGIVCVKDFFDLDDNAIKGLNKATSFLMQSKDELCDIYDSKRHKKVDKTLEELKSFVKELRDNGKEQWIYDNDYELISVYDEIVNSGLLMPKPLVYRICNNLAKVGVKDWFQYFCNDFPFDAYDKYNTGYVKGIIWIDISKDRTISKNTLGNNYIDAIGVFLRFYFTTVLCGEEYAYDPRYPVPYNMSETYASYPSDGKALINKDTKFGRNVYTPKDKAFIAPYSVEKGGVSANIREIRFDYLRRIDTSVLGDVLHNGLKNIVTIIENIKKYANYAITIADGADDMSDEELNCLCKNEKVKEIMGYIYGSRSIGRNLCNIGILNKRKMEKIEVRITGNGITEAKEDLASIADEIKREQEERWKSFVNGSSMEYLTKCVNELLEHTLDEGKKLVADDIGVYGYELRSNFMMYLCYFYRDLGGLYKVPDWVTWGKDWYIKGREDEVSDDILQQVIESLNEVWCKKRGYTSVEDGINNVQQKLKEREDKIEELNKFKTKREEELKGLARKTNKTFKLEQLGKLKEILTDVTQNWEIDKPDDYFKFNDADKIAEDISKTVLESGKVSEKQLKHILKALYVVDDKIYIEVPEQSMGNDNLKVSLDDNRQMKEDIDWFIENKHKDEWKDKIDKDLGNDKDKLLAICFSVKKWGTVSDRQAKWINRIRKFRETYENK